MCGRVYACVGMCGRVWACVGVCGHVWACVGMCGRVWACVGVCGRGLSGRHGHSLQSYHFHGGSQLLTHFLALYQYEAQSINLLSIVPV